MISHHFPHSFLSETKDNLDTLGPFYLYCYYFILFLFLFWGHTQRSSGITHGSGDHTILEIEPSPLYAEQVFNPLNCLCVLLLFLMENFINIYFFLLDVLGSFCLKACPFSFVFSFVGLADWKDLGWPELTF